MTYADGLLAPGESIIRRERQHWIFPFLVAGRWVAIAAVVGLIGFILSFLVLNPDEKGIISDVVGFLDTLIGWVTLIALAIAAVGFVWAILVWQSQEYVLTDRRVMRVWGVINKQSSDSSLENVTDAQIEVPWLGRMLGYGDLRVLTPADTGVDELKALPDPVDFKKSMMTAKDERLVAINTPRTPTPPVRAETAPAPAAAPAPAPAPAATPQPAQSGSEDVTKTLASLAELRDSGAITPEEYDAKKRELLERI
jgi:uncharacterized membrane protein YdbT with pleckstrin-like domain